MFVIRCSQRYSSGYFFFHSLSSLSGWGISITFFADEEVEDEIGYFKKQLIQKGIRRLTNSHEYTGSFGKSRAFEGYGSLKEITGWTYQGNFLSGRMHGTGV